MKLAVLILLKTVAEAKVVRETNLQPFVRSPFEGHSKEAILIAYDNGSYTSRLSALSAQKTKRERTHHDGERIHLEQTLDPALTFDSAELLYSGSLFMGYHQAQIDGILFDTASGWTMVASTDCTSCTVPTYDYSASADTYKEMQTLDADLTVTSFDETRSVDGTQVWDWVCLGSDPDTCLTDLKWVNVATDGLGSSFSGVLGFAADVDGIDYGIVTPEPTAGSFIDTLYEAGMIENK